MDKRQSHYYLNQLRDLSRGYPVDPLSGDLGTFDSRLMQFTEPIEDLICPYTHQPYPEELYPKLAQLRTIFLQWQANLLNNLGPGERRSYLLDQDNQNQNRQVIEAYLRYGFRFDEFADRVGYSAGSLRNRYKRSDYHQPTEPTAVTRRQMNQGGQSKTKMSTVVRHLGQQPHPRQYGRTITNILLKRK